MPKSATDVMQEILFSTVLDSIAALKSASKGVPNTMLRDLNAVHANTTFADLPKELQDAIAASVRAAFTRLLKEGYSVSTGQPPARPQPPRREGQGPAPRQGRPPPRRDGPSGPRPPRRDGPSGTRPPRGGGRPGPKRGS